MPLRIDDPLAWGTEMGFRDDIMEQFRESMGILPLPDDDPAPSGGMPLPDLRDLFSDRTATVTPDDSWNDDRMSRRLDWAMGEVFDDLNPNADLGTNLWNVGTGFAENMGIDLGPLGALNPGGNLMSNAWNVARWAGRNLGGGGEGNLDVSQMFSDEPDMSGPSAPTGGAAPSPADTVPNAPPPSGTDAQTEPLGEPKVSLMDSLADGLLKRGAGVLEDTMAAGEDAVLKKVIQRAITALFL